MLFAAPQQRQIESGLVTLTFRAWSAARVRAGGVYGLGSAGSVGVDEITRVLVRAIGAEEVAAAGFATVDALLAEVRRGTGRSITPGDELFRIRFHYVAGGRPERARHMTAEEAAARLTRMDAQAAEGAWTAATLAAIRDRPRVAARVLAAAAGRERLAFKADVRKLKVLGLTVSHEVGYELTSAGRDVLALVEGG